MVHLRIHSLWSFLSAGLRCACSVGAVFLILWMATGSTSSLWKRITVTSFDSHEGVFARRLFHLLCTPSVQFSRLSLLFSCPGTRHEEGCQFVTICVVIPPSWERFYCLDQSSVPTSQRRTSFAEREIHACHVRRPLQLWFLDSVSRRLLVGMFSCGSATHASSHGIL